MRYVAKFISADGLTKFENIPEPVPVLITPICWPMSFMKVDEKCDVTSLVEFTQRIYDRGPDHFEQKGTIFLEYREREPKR